MKKLFIGVFGVLLISLMVHSSSSFAQSLITEGKALKLAE